MSQDGGTYALATAHHLRELREALAQRRQLVLPPPRARSAPGIGSIGFIGSAPRARHKTTGHRKEGSSPAAQGSPARAP
eukprot:816950-Rhodomonas_salina.4